MLRLTFLKKCEDAKNFCDFNSKSSKDETANFMILSFSSLVSEKLSAWSEENPNSSKREFWKQFRAEMISQLSYFKSLELDLENYLTQRLFIDYERNYYCRNYFVLSMSPISECGECSHDFENCNECCTFRLKNGRYKILGYFSLAGKTIHLSDNLNTKRKVSRLARSSLKKANFVETYLIGHLSKNYFNNYNQEISGSDLFFRIMTFIQKGNLLLGINVVRVDCVNQKQVIQFYTKHGFKELPPVIRKEHETLTLSQKQLDEINGNLIVMVRSVY